MRNANIRVVPEGDAFRVYALPLPGWTVEFEGQNNRITEDTPVRVRTVSVIDAKTASKWRKIDYAEAMRVAFVKGI